MGNITTPGDHHEVVASLRTRIVIGGFICAIGYGVLALGASLFMRTWRDSRAELYGIGSLALAALAIWLFYGIRVLRLRGELQSRVSDPIGARRDVTGTHDRLRHLVRDLVATLQEFGQTMAALLFLAAVVWFTAVAYQNVKQPDTKYFALSLPMPAATDTNSPTNSKVNGTGAARAPQSPNAVLVWRLQSDGDPVPAGAPPILLGALLIVGFGLWFPTIELAQSKGPIALSEKLVAPILSAALIALGASQQTDAAHTSANRDLTEQGLPPTIEVGAPRSAHDVIFQNPKTLSPGGDEYLTDSLADLDRNVQGVTNSVTLLGDDTNTLSNDAKAVGDQLNVLAVALANPRTGDADPRIDAISNAIDNLGTKIDQDSNQSLATSKHILSNTQTVLNQVTVDEDSICAQTEPLLTELLAQDVVAGRAEAAYAKRPRILPTLGAAFRVGPDPRYTALRAAHDAVSSKLAQVVGVRSAARCNDWTPDVAATRPVTASLSTSPARQVR